MARLRRLTSNKKIRRQKGVDFFFFSSIINIESKERSDTMAVSRRVERDLIRKQYLEIVSEFLATKGEDVLRVKSNEIALPVVGCEDSEDFLVITFKVPTGANKGTEPYDAYEMAEEYERSLKEKEAKAKAKAEAKAKKMARDAEIRKKKAEIAKKKEG